MTDSANDLNEAKQALREAEAALEYALKNERKSITEQQLRIAELAHEIRTPLNAVMGYAQVLSQEIMGPLGKPEYVEYARIVHSAADHLLRVCDGMLDEFTPDETTKTISVEDVDAVDVINSVVELFSWTARERRIELTATTADDFPPLETDPTRLNQILINLVSNAIKFTPKGGSVNVAARVDETEGAMILVIQDNGDGMTEEEMLNKLEPYIKTDDQSPHGDRNTGLGLTIAHRLTRELNGILCLASAKGKGTIVSVRLPTGSKEQRAEPQGEHIIVRQAHDDEFAPLIP